MSEVNKYQVDGQHYKADVQHWDFVIENGLGYLEGCATKYAIRNRKKHSDPTIDLQKAIHYVKKLQESHLAGISFNRRPHMQALTISVESFADFNNLSANERQVTELLTYWDDAADLQDAIEVLENMINEAKNDQS